MRLVNYYKYSLIIICILFYTKNIAQPICKWQQKVHYTIYVTLNTTQQTLIGHEHIIYANHSPDTLRKMFIHLYWNAFQPNSSMDNKSRALGNIVIGVDKNGNDIKDWDSRITNRIQSLDSSQQGYMHISNVEIDNKKAKQIILYETIAEIILPEPLLPNSTHAISMAFLHHIPIMIRRAGRNNREGIQYSMAQWYPKIAGYDAEGWHPDPYVQREFDGEIGSFDVHITLPKKFIVAATGTLFNADSIGYGYSKHTTLPLTPSHTLTWIFSANHVNDFVWAADTGYKHVTSYTNDHILLQLFYKPSTPQQDSTWLNILWSINKMMPWIENTFGKYLYPTYSFIQGGDGGMEYPMATLIESPRMGVAAHEFMHSWYQQMISTNENEFPWLDEGFTSFSSDELLYQYYQTWASQSPFIPSQSIKGLQDYALSISKELPLMHQTTYNSYYKYAQSPFEEPLSTPSDYYTTNIAYEQNAYSKGNIFLSQLGYLVGDSVRNRILLAYYNDYHFKHPNDNDFIRMSEKISGLQLQWYRKYWIYMNAHIRYELGNILTDTTTGNAIISIVNQGTMPMPIDLLITYKNGTEELHYIPLNIMYGIKPSENNTKRIVHSPWNFTQPTYSFMLQKPISYIKEIQIDPTKRLANTDKKNNVIIIPDM